MTELIPNSLSIYIERITPRLRELELLLQAPEVSADPRLYARTAQELRTLSAAMGLYQEMTALVEDYRSLSHLLTASREEEERKLFQSELSAVQTAVQERNEKLNRLLLPDIPDGERDARLEIKTGKSGGKLLSLLTALYQGQAERNGLTCEVQEHEKGAVLTVKGYGAYARFSYESGLHRLEGKGTWDAAVTVFPLQQRISYSTDVGDVRIDLFHASGAGGQNVNKVQTAVRLTHLATGTVVTCQDERSQLKNKERAFSRLKEKLEALSVKEQESVYENFRKKQARSGYTTKCVRIYREGEGLAVDTVSALTAPITALLRGERDFYTESAALRKNGSLDD